MPGLNLRGIANQAIQNLNPDILAQICTSTGYEIGKAGKRTPTFESRYISVQVQPMSTGDIQKVDGLNIQGVMRKIYLSAEAFGKIRSVGRGGDQLVLPAGAMPESPCETRWIVSAVLEAYQSGWRSCAITLQGDAGA